MTDDSDRLKATLSDDIKEWTKSMLVDAAMRDQEIHVSSFNETVVLYAKRGTYKHSLFRWHRPKDQRHVIRWEDPLTIAEAIALVEDNWARRTFTEGREKLP